MVTISLFLMNIHIIYMGSLIVPFTIANLVVVHDHYSMIFGPHLFNSTINVLLVFVLLYMNTVSSKKGFLLQKKTIALLQEQVRIINELPDGAIIHKQVKIQGEDTSE